MSRSGVIYQVKNPNLIRAAAFLVPEGIIRVHQFLPHGRSVAVIGTTHQVIFHTWPEHGLVTLDLYPARDLADFEAELGWKRA